MPPPQHDRTLHVHAQRPGSPIAPLSGEPVPIRLGGRYLVRNDRVRADRAAVIGMPSLPIAAVLLTITRGGQIGYSSPPTCFWVLLNHPPDAAPPADLTSTGRIMPHPDPTKKDSHDDSVS
jgi:hypothetical protein